MNFEEVFTGLMEHQKTIHPKFLYDDIGSEIFEEICETEDYYPTRAEKEILEVFGSEIAQMIGSDVTIIEPGSGSSEKIEILLPKLKNPRRYVPVEISSEILQKSSMRIKKRFPELNILALCCDFMNEFDFEHEAQGQKEVVFFPGSTIGNFDPNAALAFLKRLSSMISSRGGFLIGVDTKKKSDVFQKAYDDRHGVTARFNLNLLERVNRELEGDFKVANFTHEVCYNELKGRVEMHLKSLLHQEVRIKEKIVNFKRGETIHTENSYKYSPEEFEELGRKAGLRPIKNWQDSNGLFRVYYFEKE